MISGYSPSRSGGLAQDYINAFESVGHEVDFLTMYHFPGQKENQYNIYPEPLKEKLVRIRDKFRYLNIFKRFAHIIFHNPEDKLPSVRHNGFIIHNLDERTPPLPNHILLKHLPNIPYDFVYILIVQRMLTSSSFLTIYEKYKAPLILAAVDMLHMTGGCYYFGDCERFGKGCGLCPVLESTDPNDITHKNYLFKAEVYSKIPHGLRCNLYQSKYAIKSGLFSERTVFVSTILIDENKFKPYDQVLCRNKFGIPEKKDFIILARYEYHLSRMKGYDHMLNILNGVYDKMATELRNKSLLVLIGGENEEYTSQIKLDHLFLGRLNEDDLIKCYNACSVFISTSIDDAGPSMVNQSMMCGTPVVSFSIGTALQVTKEGVSGYMIPNYDDIAFANALLKISNMDHGKYQKFRKTTRDVALNLNSRSANVARIIEIYELLRDRNKTI